MTLFLITRGELFVSRMLCTPSAVTRPARTAQAIAPFSAAIKALALVSRHSHRTDREMRGYLAARRNESEQYSDRVSAPPFAPVDTCAQAALSAIGPVAPVATTDPEFHVVNTPFLEDTPTAGDAELDGGDNGTNPL